MSRSEGLDRALRRVVSATALVGAVALAAVLWASSRIGDESVMAMAHVDTGSGPAIAHAHGGDLGTSVVDLAADRDRAADVTERLVVRSGRVDVPGGSAVEGITVNGSSPGPTLRARQGQLVEVVLVNESVAGGTTLHWHGVDVPNAADGVAGVTQDAVPVGGTYTYRFVADRAGTYWYHAHQLSHRQVEAGLLGAVVVEPARGSGTGAGDTAYATDVVALLHVYGGQHTLNGAARDERVTAVPGTRVRVRVVNTDQGTAAVWASSPYRVVAVDGTDVVGPTDVTDRRLLVPAGGRADVSVVVPPKGAAVRLHVGGARSVLVGDGPAPAPVPQARADVDLLGYGSPAPLGLDPAKPDRSFDYRIGRRPGLLDGRAGMFWTINGHLFPDVPMFLVREGEVVRVHVANDSGEVHPMHLHGHHVVVLTRNGVAARGSPWWVDSLDVHPGEEYDLAFVADNPGIWSDHCHTLQHATDGLMTHLAYAGVTTPFRMNGPTHNRPE